MKSCTMLYYTIVVDFNNYARLKNGRDAYQVTYTFYKVLNVCTFKQWIVTSGKEFHIPLSKKEW